MSQTTPTPEWSRVARAALANDEEVLRALMSRKKEGPKTPRDVAVMALLKKNLVHPPRMSKKEKKIHLPLLQAHFSDRA